MTIQNHTLHPSQCKTSAGFVCRMAPQFAQNASTRVYLRDGSYVDASDSDGGIWVIEAGAVQRALYAAGYVPSNPPAPVIKAEETQVVAGGADELRA